MRRHESKDTYIEHALMSHVGMVLGKFLVPEVCKELGVTIEDLPKLEPLLARLDDRHKYEEIIFRSYLENGSFTLTDEQRLTAYESYKQSRAT